MAIHSLGGRASIDVMSVSGSFGSITPSSEQTEEMGLRLKFSRPNQTLHTAKITFKFKTKDHPKGTSFGIKQFLCTDWYNFSLKGNKPIDGWIWASFKFPGDRYVLDVSTAALEPLFDSNGMPTGARATAPQAPFYSDGPAVVKSGADIELSITDAPGGSIPLEMRNAATDRINYLDSVNIKQTFLTVLTAVSEDNTHTPLEAAYWQQNVKGTVIWDSRGQPNVSNITAVNQGLGTLKNINNDFLICNFNLLTNASLKVDACMNQRFNDALFTVRGMYKRQDFTRSTRALTKLEAKGYQLIQYPMIQ